MLRVSLQAPAFSPADAPTVVVNDRVAAVDETARTPTVVPSDHADTLILPSQAAGGAPARVADEPSRRTGIVRYVVERLAGKGGMGTVHVARDVELLRRVALKALSNDVANDRTARARFVREVQVTAQLDHPHIVPVYGLEIADGGRPAYAMKLVEGRTFAQVIAETKREYEAGGVGEQHSLTTRLEHFVKVCDAMAYAHARGVVHRDLKPANLMLGPHNEVYVMDWGICRVLAVSSDDESSSARAVVLSDEIQTLFGGVVGTPLYMSPEQARGCQALDARSDLCSLGLILFELVTLRRPFTGRTTMELLEQAAAGAHETIAHAHGEAIPRELAAIVERAISRDPSDRYADVNAFAHDLRRYLRGDAVSALPESRWQQLVRRLARHRERVAVAVLGFALIAVIAIVGVVWRSDRALKAQQARERRMEAFASEVAEAGDRLETRLLNIWGELDALAMVTTYATEFGTPSAKPIAWLERPGRGADGQGDEGAYSLLSGGSRSAADALARRLTEVQSHQRRLLALAREALGGSTSVAVGTPEAVVQELVTVFESGLIHVVPASTRSERRSDPRTSAWYRAAAVRPGVQWAAVDATQSHAGRELVVGEAIRTAGGQVRGGVGLVLSLDSSLINLMTERQIPDARATLLLDADGTVLATYGEASRPERRSQILRALPLADIERKSQSNDVGFVEIDGLGAPAVVAYDGIDPLGWRLVSIADSLRLARQPEAAAQPKRSR